MFTWLFRRPFRPSILAAIELLETNSELAAQLVHEYGEMNLILRRENDLLRRENANLQADNDNLRQEVGMLDADRINSLRNPPTEEGKGKAGE
jgi:hypothetical protein